MTKVIRKEIKKITYFGSLSIGDCFFDKDNYFCIKVDSKTCLMACEDIEAWSTFRDCSASDEVYPLDVEIHIVS
jgi:hypothetical protein